MNKYNISLDVCHKTTFYDKNIMPEKRKNNNRKNLVKSYMTKP